MVNNRGLSSAAFSIAAILAVAIGLPVIVATAMTSAYTTDGSISWPVNDPAGAPYGFSSATMTSSGVYDAANDGWCSDGSWNGTVKEGVNFGWVGSGPTWTGCPTAWSLSTPINGEPAFIMNTCSYFIDNQHQLDKCGNNDLEWNLYGYDAFDRVFQDSTMSSFNLKMSDYSPSNAFNCSDPTLAGIITGDLVIEVHTGTLAAMPYGSGQYRTVKNQSITIFDGSFSTLNHEKVYELHGVDYCTSAFNLQIPIDPFIGESVREMTDGVLNEAGVPFGPDYNLTWFTLKIDSLYADNHGNYDSWSGYLPWDLPAESSYSIGFEVGYSEPETATNALKVWTWGMAVVIGALALASTPYWNPVVDRLSKNMKEGGF